MVITSSILKNKYKEYINPLDKIKRDVDSGKLIRLTNGLYETDRTTSPHLLAAFILSPSYLSFDYALEFYGLIPERCAAITSASLNVKKNKTYINEFGRYTYSDIPKETFSEGLLYLDDVYKVKIASKEKAICDSLYKWRVIHSVKELKRLLFEDKRIAEEEFKSCDFKEMIRLCLLYKSTNLSYLIKLIKKEYLHE